MCYPTSICLFLLAMKRSHEKLKDRPRNVRKKAKRRAEKRRKYRFNKRSTTFQQPRNQVNISKLPIMMSGNCYWKNYTNICWWQRNYHNFIHNSSNNFRYSNYDHTPYHARYTNNKHIPRHTVPSWSASNSWVSSFIG